MPTETKVPIVMRAGEGTPMAVIGNPVTRKLTSRETGGDSYVFEAVTPPGGGAPLHVHRHEDELAYVLEGEFEFQLGGHLHRATPGTVIFAPRTIPHSFRNVGATPGKIFWIVSPGVAFEKFFDELAILPSEGPPDLLQVGAIFSKYEIELLPLDQA